MTTIEAIEQLIETAPVPLPDQSRFNDGWDAGYMRGLEVCLRLAEAASK